MILIGLIVLSLALGLTAWLGFVWSVRSGQYDDPEGPKYRMLEDDDQPQPPPPGGEGKGGGDLDGRPPEPPVGMPKA